MFELVTPERLAEELGITKKTLAQWRYRGAGPRFMKLGGTAHTSPVRYRRTDIVDWLNAQEIRGGDPVR
ncbi:helix-turn-helix transcriptional regulator [Streptomyces tendae]|uniref:helix-turn-helix transcriptional regulator n=1 Tax=Streptomyces tendae TaxID=1932 RepID=UPI003D70A204